MSNQFSGGQLFGAILGAAVGFFLAPAGAVALYMSIGSSIGMTVGGIIDPPDQQVIKQEGSRLGDLSVQTAEWGVPIPRLFGTFRMAGNVIWALPLHETKHVDESGDGKGGGGTKTETTWYSYAGSWAVGFCEGEVSGIKKIWFDSVLVYDNTNYTGGLNATNHSIYLGTSTQPIDWYIQANNPDTPAYRNLVYIVFNKIELENYGNVIPKVTCEIAQDGQDDGFGVFVSNQVSVSSICEELLLRAGLNNNDFNLSEGVDLVNGYVLSHPMDTRNAISQLISAYNFELIESFSKLNLKKRNSTSLTTIDKDGIIEFTKIDRLQTVELSKAINIIYANKDKNYDAGVQSIMRNDSNTENTKSYQFAIALSDDQAKQIAERYLYTEWNERLEFEFTLISEYFYLEPTNVITLLWKRSEFVVRLTKITYATDGSLICKASLEDQTIYNTISQGSNTAETIIDDKVLIAGVTDFELLDIPMLDNIYNSEGIYIAANGSSNGWKGCGIDKSIDNEITYSQTGVIINGTLIGEATTILSSGTTTTYDLINSVTILLPSGELFSESWENLLLGKNYILIGDEILQYKDSQDNLDGTFTLSKLLRGRRGTEWAIGNHAIGDRFVFFDTDMMFDATASLNVDSYYKATTFGDFIEDSIAKFIRPEIRCLKPLSPSYVKAIRESNNDITITWKRRSRDVTGYLKTLQLFEETESYEIEIETGIGRILTSTSETVTYLASQQTTDGITLGNPVTFTVYQISGIVQRGYGTQETI